MDVLRVKVAIIACEWHKDEKAMDFNLQVYALVEGMSVSEVKEGEQI